MLGLAGLLLVVWHKLGIGEVDAGEASQVGAVVTGQSRHARQSMAAQRVGPQHAQPAAGLPGIPAFARQFSAVWQFTGGAQPAHPIRIGATG